MLLKSVAMSLNLPFTKTLHRAAHTSKGSLQNFQAHSVAEIAQQIESQAKAGNPDKAGELISRLRPVVARMLKEVSFYFRRSRIKA